MKNRVISSVKNFFFPTFCLHCGDTAERYLCKACTDMLQLLEPSSCSLDCITSFEHFGPAKSLLQTFKSGRRPGIASSLASWMVVQLLKLDRPLPDLIVPIPQSLSRTLQIGYNPPLLIAKEIARILEKPYASLLKASGLRLRQESLNLEERRRLSTNAFQWRKFSDLSAKRILLVDDFVVTAATLKAAKRRLCEAFPLDVYACAFTRLIS